MNIKVKWNNSYVLIIPSIYVILNGILNLNNGIQLIWVLPVNPYINYYGYPHNLIIFGCLCTILLLKYKFKGFILFIFTFCLWEILYVQYTNPLQLFFLIILIYTYPKIKPIFKVDWKAFSIVLLFIVATVTQALPKSLQAETCSIEIGKNICTPNNTPLFLFVNIGYTTFLFFFIWSSLRCKRI
jgi:hypothetical protein